MHLKPKMFERHRIWHKSVKFLNYMTKRIQLLPSGIPLVDMAWGGLYRGGTYFLIGPRKSGRTLLTLQYALECAKQKEVCLFFTNMRPKDLLIHAASIDFDLQHYMNQNLIIVVRVTSPANIEEEENPDEILAEYLKDIVSVVDQYRPNKIVFDELTPLVGFSDKEFLKEVFLETIEKVEDAGITSLYVLGEPATPVSHDIVNTLTVVSTGVITLRKTEDIVSNLQPGTMSIEPNIGHTEGKFTAPYYIEPYKGIIVDFKPVQGSEFAAAEREKSKSKYQSLAELELPPDTFASSNLYSTKEFELILNNQIAMYKVTGQKFSLVSIRLDETAESRKLLTLNQLINAVRLSIDKKDKLSKVGNKILILVPRENGKAVRNIITKIKNNLPNNDPAYLKTLAPLISVYSIEVSKDIHNAKEMLARILSDNSSVNNQTRA